MRQALGILGLATVLAAAALTWRNAAADDTGWPRRLDTERGTFTVYQPQPERFEGNTLEARAALSLRTKPTSEPTFGVVWFTAKADTDRDAGTVVLRELVVTKVRWPDSNPTDEADVAKFITGVLPEKSLPINFEQLKASLATVEREKQSLDDLRHEPPKIIFTEELAVLLLYDGEPRTLAIPNNGDLEQVANSALAVVHDKKGGGTYYLNGGKFWYSAKDAKGPWAPIDEPPADVAMLIPTSAAANAPALAKPPKIVVATEPTELIATDGPPNWQTVGKGELLFVENSETPVVRDVASNGVFVLISGRWYRAAGLEGPWAVVRPDELPAAFKNIEPSSRLAGVRVSVAGTPEAEDASLDALVPQTAAIDRSKAKLELQYDGEPKFKQIEGTGVEYATNTAAQVLRIKGKYYACDDGVWFVSDQAKGPWAVADSVPTEEIQKIPASEPVYNVKYVTVYESTPEVVYVGYTPGYMWSYPWYGVPVYGTGWYYPPYWGSVYYPRPYTWGMHVAYNPYTGWGVGLSYTWGFMTVGVVFGGGYGGYYRPGYPPYYYRPPYYPPGGYRPGYGYGPRPTPYGGGGVSAGQLPAGGGRVSAGQLPAGGGGASAGQLPAAGGGVSAGQLPASAGNNLYHGASAQDRVANSGASAQSLDRTARGANNVYADQAGTVHRENSGGWESRSGGQWQTPSTSNRPSQAPSNLNRDYGARQTGASNSMARPSYGGGGGRGGGGRRR